MLGAAILLLVAAYLVRPFIDKRAYRSHDPDPEISALLAERDRILGLISDLDSDYAMGKLDAEEYRSRRAKLVKRGAHLLREIDGLREGQVQEDAESAASERDRALEAEIAKRRRNQEGTAQAGECPNCGAQVERRARACSHCGEPLKMDAGT